MLILCIFFPLLLDWSSKDLFYEHFKALIVRLDVVSALKKLRQKNYKFTENLSYPGRTDLKQTNKTQPLP